MVFPPEIFESVLFSVSCLLKASLLQEHWPFMFPHLSFCPHFTIMRAHSE
jgi:hypothetical protein